MQYHQGTDVERHLLQNRKDHLAVSFKEAGNNRMVEVEKRWNQLENTLSLHIHKRQRAFNSLLVEIIKSLDKGMSVCLQG